MALDDELTRWAVFRDAALEDAFRRHVWSDQTRRVRQVAMITALLLPVTILEVVVVGAHPWFAAAVFNRSIIMALGVWLWRHSIRAEPGPEMERRMWIAVLPMAILVGVLCAVRESSPFANLLANSTFVFYVYLGLPLRVHLSVVPAMLATVIYAPTAFFGHPEGDFGTVLIPAYLPVVHLLGVTTRLHMQRSDRQLFGRLQREQTIRQALEIEVEQRRRIQNALEDAKVAAESADRSKTIFLATMSHEIRTPLNGILGLSELLMFDELPPGSRRSLDAIRASATALSGLLTEVLDLSRMDADGLSLRSEPFDMGRLARESVTIVAPSASSKGVAMTGPDDVECWVAGDVSRVRQVLLNLLGNAVKFTEEGSVRLRLKTSRHTGGIEVVVEVADTGVGIAADQLPFVFERFRQADAGHDRAASGAGLGLAISRTIIEEMGGSMTASSELGQGSCFGFTVVMPEAVAPRPQTRSTHARAEGLSVLVVDDDAINRMVVLGMLRRLGHAATSVSSGAEAIAWLVDAEVDVVLMDVQMPGMSGLETTEALRKRGATTPILALTANAMPADRDACLGAGMDGYLSKPVSMAELGRALDDVVAVT